MVEYFSEREGREAPRDQEVIGPTFWGALIAVVRVNVGNGFLAEAFPDGCLDAPAIACGVDETSLGRTLQGHVPGIEWPLRDDPVPETIQVLDLIEFLAARVSEPRVRRWHDYYKHEDLRGFDREAGRAAFAEEINTLLRRCGHPYELRADTNRVERLAAEELQGLLGCRFRTGDDQLDTLLETACERFRSPSVETRHEGLERLWDAFERLKTLHVADNKKASMEKVLEAAVPEATLRERISEEARVLTTIGNTFTIRHHERDKVRIEESQHIDYLFHRLLALIWMILKGRGAVE